MTTSTPDQLRLLGSGAHLHPRDGACLMEYVSVLVGEPFTDHPRCTDQVVADLARRVNDATSDGGRPQLARRAPDLSRTGPGHPGTSAAVVVAVLEAAAAVQPGNPKLARHLQRARRRLERSTAAGSGLRQSLADGCYRRGSAAHALTTAIRSATCLPEVERDAALAAFLDAGLAAARAHGSGADGRPDRISAAVATPTCTS